MAQIKYLVTNPQALEDAIASERSPSLKGIMCLIRENPQIGKAGLLRLLVDAPQPSLQNRHPHTLSNRVTDAFGKLVDAGAVQREVVSLDSFAAQFGLTKQQFGNYYHWLVYADIFPATTHRNMMSYQPEVTDVFNAAKPLYQNGVSHSEALGFGVGVVFGDKKKKQFEEWWRGRIKNLTLENMLNRRSMTISKLRTVSGEIPSRIRTPVMYDAMRQALAGGRQADAAKISELLESRLFSDWVASGSYDSMIMSFPMNLYFTLKKVPSGYAGKQGKHKQRRNFPDEVKSSLRAAMEAATLSKAFESYKQSVHGRVSEFWGYAAESIRAPLQETLDAVVERTRMVSGSDNYEIRSSAKAVFGDFEVL
ncbi:hypothetical protein HYU12_00795, partial [Candidatus Woesearchaeota archaeon]|nr:hypothetical protein [Candidatus Woesearchaeota archaeon]